jgi:hypothetical protein
MNKEHSGNFRKNEQLQSPKSWDPVYIRFFSSSNLCGAILFKE